MSGHGVALRVEACGKTFADGTRALDPVTLDIARGETLVLLGPSGCGKTTLLRIIAGLETPDAGGRILFNAADVTRVPIERRNVGMGQRHQAAEVAQHRLAETVRKEWRLRFCGIHRRAQKRTDRRASGQSERARETASNQQRRERRMRHDQHFERGRALRFCVKPPFGRAQAEIAGLVNEIDRRAARRGLPDQWPMKSADEECFGLVPGDVRAGTLDLLKTRFNLEQSEIARNMAARLGAKGALVRNFPRRDAVRLLCEIVAPEPHAIARRQGVRGKMDLHGGDFFPVRQI